MENTTPAASPITGHTGLICLLGSPCAHSVSPMMHNASFEALGLDYRYLAFDVNEETLPTAVAGLKVLAAAKEVMEAPNANRAAADTTAAILVCFLIINALSFFFLKYFLKFLFCITS